MKHFATVAIMAAALALAPTASVLAQHEQSEQHGMLPMPPSFKYDADRMEVLRGYPLGIINKQAAFVHHGKADREVQLPDGREGWVYEVSPPGQAKTYRFPGGEQRTVIERGRADSNVRAYTLVFDGRGVVVDVLSNEPGSHGGHSAAALQLDPRTAPESQAGGR